MEEDCDRESGRSTLGTCCTHGLALGVQVGVLSRLSLNRVEPSDGSAVLSGRVFDNNVHSLRLAQYCRQFTWPEATFLGSLIVRASPIAPIRLPRL